METKDTDSDYSPSECTSDKLLAIRKKGQNILNEILRILRDEYLISLRERMQSELK
jgi:hypothetical protein